MLNEYPKSVYLHGWDDLDAMLIVHDPGEEAAARLDGYKMLTEFEVDPVKRRGRPKKLSEDDGD